MNNLTLDQWRLIFWVSFLIPYPCLLILNFYSLKKLENLIKLPLYVSLVYLGLFNTLNIWHVLYFILFISGSLSTPSEYKKEYDSLGVRITAFAIGLASGVVGLFLMKACGAQLW